MMMDDNIVAVSPTTVYRILKKNNLLMPWNPKASSKGTGFKQPQGAHKHWHTDISYINIDGTFYFQRAGYKPSPLGGIVFSHSFPLYCFRV